MFGKYYEALGLLKILEYYGINYNRNYILTKVNLYKAIIFYRIGKYDEMKSQLEAAVEKAYISGLIRIIADEGAALMPAFSYVYKDLQKKYGGDKRIFLNKINEELLKMTEQYPHYLEEKCIDNVILTNN